ncbi:unnamed protein product [Musa textilis]
MGQPCRYIINFFSTREHRETSLSEKFDIEFVLCLFSILVLLHDALVLQITLFFCVKHVHVKHMLGYISHGDKDRIIPVGIQPVFFYVGACLFLSLCVPLFKISFGVHKLFMLIL